MKVLGIRWVGVAAWEYGPMVLFLRDTLGLEVAFEEPATIEFEVGDGDRFQVMGPGDAYFQFFGGNAAGPVPLFEVDDVRQARVELEEAGAEVIGETGRDVEWEWIHVRAPDGNLYEFGSRRIVALE